MFSPIQEEVSKSKLVIGEFVILNQNINSASPKALLAERVVKLVSIHLPIMGHSLTLMHVLRKPLTLIYLLLLFLLSTI